MMPQTPRPIGGRRPEHLALVSRRSWLAGVIVGLTGTFAMPRTARSMQEKAVASDAEEIAAVQAAAKKASLGPFSYSHTDHFIGLGDADDLFRKNALKICESLATDFLKHFRSKGFKLAMPERRLTVITLKDDISYQAYTGIDPGTTGGGLYDLDTNRLVMFDFRPDGQQPGAVANPVRVNLLALVHETTHLLCFNTGLLSRQKEVPKWVSEGLATYAEMWTGKRQPAIGTSNGPWLDYLRKRETPWIAIPDLVASDKSFDGDDKSAQQSYAESWLLVHFLMKEPRLTKFRAYLEGLPTEGNGDQRVEYAETHLGALKSVDHDLGRELKRQLR
jgi:hypothetical protein